MENSADKSAEVRSKTVAPHDFSEERHVQEHSFEKLIEHSQLVEAEKFSDVVVTELSLKPNKHGKFDVFWNCQNPRARDLIGIFVGDPMAKKQKAFLGYVWINNKTTANESTEIHFSKSDEAYYAVYMAQENDKAAFIKSVAVTTEKHEAFLTEENKTFVINWSNPHSVGFKDYIALFDFKPSLGTTDANRYLFWQWQWAVNAVSGSYKTGTQDNDTTIYYVAYCTNTTHGYSIVDIAGVVSGYTMKNVTYELDNSEPKYEPVRPNLVTLKNTSDDEATLSGTVAITNSIAQTWSTTHAWKLGVKVQFDAKIPFVGIGGKWDVSAEVSGSYTTGSSVTTSDSFSGSVSVKAKPHTEVDINSMLLLAHSPEIKYTADLGVMFRGDNTTSVTKKINGVFTTNSAQKIEITAGNVRETKDRTLLALPPVEKDAVPIDIDHRYTFFYHPVKGWPTKPQLEEKAQVQDAVMGKKASITK